MGKATLSIIIPVINEAAVIQQVIGIAQTVTETEIIVVDGGSRDSTVEIARSLEVQVLTTAPGRATQMNLGASVATGDILLFLHGDTCLPANFADWVHQTLEQPGVVAGAFELKIAAQGWGVRLIEQLVQWRSHWFQMPYGDQAIFLTAEQFRWVGQFPEQPLMEDFELIRRLRRWGKIAIAPVPVVTSGRRWQKLGVLKTTLLNQRIILAYLLGVSPQRLMRWYRQ